MSGRAKKSTRPVTNHSYIRTWQMLSSWGLSLNGVIHNVYFKYDGRYSMLIKIHLYHFTLLCLQWTPRSSQAGNKARRRDGRRNNKDRCRLLITVGHNHFSKYYTNIVGGIGGKDEGESRCGVFGVSRYRYPSRLELLDCPDLRPILRRLSMWRTTSST